MGNDLVYDYDEARGCNNQVCPEYNSLEYIRTLSLSLTSQVLLKVEEHSSYRS